MIQSPSCALNASVYHRLSSRKRRRNNCLAPAGHFTGKEPGSVERLIGRDEQGLAPDFLNKTTNRDYKPGLLVISETAKSFDKHLSGFDVFLHHAGFWLEAGMTQTTLSLLSQQTAGRKYLVLPHV